MSITRKEISEWFDEGIKQEATHMLIVCDGWDYEDYPVYVKSIEEAQKKAKNPGEMKRVMEVYKLSMDKENQLNEHRSFNY